jgi:hypothetical protein
MEERQETDELGDGLADEHLVDIASIISCQVEVVIERL